MRHARFVPAGSATIIEQWFLKMEKAIAHRRVLHAQLMSDGAVIAITRYDSGLSPFLAGCELVDDIWAIVRHVRAARRERSARPLVDLRAELQTAVEEVQELAEEGRELIALLRAEEIHGRSRLTDCLVIASARRAESVLPTQVLPPLNLVEALFERMDAIKAFPKELDALLEGAVNKHQRP